MSNLLQNCCVCVRNNEGLINISAFDKDQIEWHRKLNKCVPEVDWSYDYFICPECIQQLQVAFTFYEHCLQSNRIRMEQIFPVKIETEDFPAMVTLKDETGAINHINWVSPKIEETHVSKHTQTETEELVANGLNTSDLMISRKELFNIMKTSNSKGDETKFLRNYLYNLTNCPKELERHIYKPISQFTSEIKLRWQASHRNKGLFLTKNKNWLERKLSFPQYSGQKKIVG